jgi:hypothetical protein
MNLSYHYLRNDAIIVIMMLLLIVKSSTQPDGRRIRRFIAYYIIIYPTILGMNTFSNNDFPVLLGRLPFPRSLVTKYSNIG